MMLMRFLKNKTDDDDVDLNGPQMVFELILLLIVFVVITYVIFFVIIPSIEDPNYLQNKIADADKREKDRHAKLTEMKMIVKFSTDCPKLKDVQLELISKGGKKGKWFPGIYDRYYEMANARHELLCSGG